MDFTKTCRTCLAADTKDAEMKSVFAFDEEDQQYAAMIAACSTTTVNNQDGLPDRICLPCCSELRNCLAFKAKCEQSFQTLQLYRESMILPDNPEQHTSNRFIKLETVTANTPTISGDYHKYKNRELFAPKANEKSVQTDEVTFYMCEMCDMKFVSTDALRMHRPLHQNNGFRCRVCSSMFGRLTHLRRHIASVHPDAARHGGQKQYDIVCKVCDRRFARTDNLQRHLLTHGTDDDNNATEAIIEEREWECVKCKLSFSSKMELIDHGNCGSGIGNASNAGITKKKIRPEDTNTMATFFDSTTDHARISESLKPEAHSDFDYSDLEILPEVGVDYIDVPTEQLDEEESYEEKAATEPPKRGRGRPKKIPAVPPGKVTPTSKRGCPSTKNTILPDTDVRTTGDPESSFQCDKCSKMFSRLTHLKRHLVIHSGVKPFMCEVCKKGFTRLDHLRIHRHHHSPVKPYNCDICQRGFTRAAHLLRHKECRHTECNANPNTVSCVCEICTKNFSSLKSLRLHMKVHIAKVHACKFCPYHFANKDELIEHNKLHIHEKPYLCSECGARFVRNDYLTVHMRRHKGDKPYKCKFCGKGFPRATDLTVHERYHTGEKTHLCTTCGKGFNRAYNLLVHMRVHTGERPYQCPHCDKSFAQGNDMKTHVRRHTGERYKCNVCGEGFIQGYHLTQHKKKKHGIEVQSHIQRVEKFVQVKPQHDDDAEEHLDEEESDGVLYSIEVEEAKLSL